MPRETESLAARRWDGEYASGRYRDEGPVDFVADIVRSVEPSGVERRGLYIGCGNGRNYLPLVAAGLDLVGLDISAEAIRQLCGRCPERAHRLVAGDLECLPAHERYPLIVGIQVFQHGTSRATHAHVREAQRRLEPGGIFCLRVNAAGTDVEFRHDVIERADDGFTVRYRDGPKRGLDIHFFGARELEALFAGYESLVDLHRVWARRVPASRGSWCQWEAIWRKPMPVTG